MSDRTTLFEGITKAFCDSVLRCIGIFSGEATLYFFFFLPPIAFIEAP